MKRPLPVISKAQAKSIATYSKFQAQSEARDEEIKVMSAELDRSFAKASADFKKLSAANDVIGKWFVRIAVIPVTLLAMTLIYIVGHGLWSGDFPAISKYSRAHVFRGSNPVAYWFAFAYHSAMSVAFSYLGIKLLQATKWFTASKI